MATLRSTVLAIMLVAVLVQSARAITYTVGDDIGWTIPPSLGFYDDWAGKESFVVGDKLTFKYPAGHNVYQVSAADAKNCIGTNPISMFDAANPTIQLTETGEINYICEVIGHCRLGMKMTLTVSANATVPSRTVPATTPALSPPAATKSAAPGLQFTVAIIVGSLLGVGAALSL